MNKLIEQGRAEVINLSGLPSGTKERLYKLFEWNFYWWNPAASLVVEFDDSNEDISHD